MPDSSNVIKARRFTGPFFVQITDATDTPESRGWSHSAKLLDSAANGQARVNGP